MLLRVNGTEREVEVEPETPLLWVLREQLGLPGTKYGCGVGQCGACTVLLDGNPVRSCVLPVSAVGGAAVVTIEGLGPHPVVDAWVEHQVAQCGYCQPGQVLTAVGLLARNPRPTGEEVSAFMTNLCRCGTHDRIRETVLAVAAALPAPPDAAPPAGGEG